jgi:hypothetical protein
MSYLEIREIGGRYGHRFGLYDNIGKDWIRDKDGIWATRTIPDAENKVREVLTYNVKAELKERLTLLHPGPEVEKALALIIAYMSVDPNTHTYPDQPTDPWAQPNQNVPWGTFIKERR